MPCRLPTEIFEAILTEDSLSPADLARCCLVNRSFADLARTRLYRDVTITKPQSMLTWSSEQTPEGMKMRTLRESRTCATCVRSLSIVSVDKWETPAARERLQSCISALLGHCLKLQSFHTSSTDTATHFLSSLTQTSTSRVLTGLSLPWCSIMWDLIRQQPSLTTLVLYREWSAMSTSTASRGGPILCQLKTLDFADTGGSPNASDFQALTQNSTTTLTALRLRLPFKRRGEERLFYDLSLFQCLLHLRITYNQAAFTEICADIFATIGSCPRLSRLTLDTYNRGDSWPVTTLIDSMPALPNLERLDLEPVTAWVPLTETDGSFLTAKYSSVRILGYPHSEFPRYWQDQDSVDAICAWCPAHGFEAVACGVPGDSLAEPLELMPDFWDCR
ncbi:hypothetical protein JCM10021v2_001174 [Rhodotorula toruloides]|uniref:F-box domain-containing protein n=2 Tax=Rhodotorula toruloides TaxID=5286 RepID=A0A2T0A6I6_RHOTO|nr:hypothetical protein AAT19DRAFT_15177 [Rhodotorula toruloides]